MQNLIGIINSVDNVKNNYQTLTQRRPDYMLAFGARYRIIDFTLSNVSHYNLSNVILFGGKNIRSTLDHIGNGKSWELNRRNQGLTINPPAYDVGVGLLSEIKSFYDAIDLFINANQENIYLADPMSISKIDIGKAYDEFIKRDLDVMLVYKNVDDPNLEYLNTKKLHLKDNMVESVGENLGTERNFDMYINKLFIKKSVFIELISKTIEHGNASTLIDAIILYLKNYKVGAYKSDAYVSIIHDVPSYYKANMALLDPEIYNKVFYEGGIVLTKPKDEPSTLYKPNSRVENSLVANGCIIEGYVENSIIFRGVKIGKNAIVKNSLLIQQSIVEDDAVVINTIVDKYGVIEKTVSTIGASGNPYVVPKSEIIRKG